jgi:hypothetical protein
MPTQEMVIWVARLIAAGFALMACLPHLLLLVGLRRYRGGTYGGPDDLLPDDSPDAYREKYQQLLALGFRPFGIYWSRIGRTITTESYIFGSADHPCLAQIYSRSHNLYLVTVFEGGDVIYTMDAYEADRAQPGYRVKGLLDPTVAELLAEHRRQVAARLAEGLEPLPTASLADAPPIFRAVNTNPVSFRLLTSTAASNLGIHLFVLALGAGGAGWAFGFAGLAPWAGMIAGAAFLKWLWSGSSTRVKLDPRKTTATQAEQVPFRER